MFKTISMILGLGLVVILASDADAGRIKKPKKGLRTETPEEMKNPHEFDRSPLMQFKAGILTRDLHSGWKIGDTPLHLSRNCAIYLEGAEDGFLQEGQEAVAMGSMVGGALSAWSVHISGQDYGYPPISGQREIKEPGADPDVGVLLQKAD